MKEKQIEVVKPQGEVILYKAPDGNVSLDVKLEGDTVWLTQVQMARLFEQTKQTVSAHVNNVYKEGEVERDSTVRKYLTVRKEAKAIREKNEQVQTVYKIRRHAIQRLANR